MDDPRTRALEAYLAVAVRAGHLEGGLRAYERETGISSRMLAHHFGGNEGLEHALLAVIELRLREEVRDALQSGRAANEIAGSLDEPTYASLLDLLRPLLQRALSGHAPAVALMAVEQDRWRKALSDMMPDEDVDQALFILIGGAVATMVRGLATEEQRGVRR